MNISICAPEGTPTRSPVAAQVERRRTFAIISHPDAGKTTLTEKLLFFCGAIQLAGQVKAKRAQRTTRSDWMAIERERGISVVTSVMTFEHDGHVFNLLDTPGHEDFSEDTYRTLTAVDSAVMVIDAAKGIEPRTRKLFEVCRLRDIPIITFINKMDGESRDPLDLIDEIEKTLALDAAPITWPIGRGGDFIGTIHVESSGVRLLDGDAGSAGKLHQMALAEIVALSPKFDPATFTGELDLVRHACKRFDPRAFGEGHMTPVFFGSALKDFGVGDLLKALAEMAPPPRARNAANWRHSDRRRGTQLCRRAELRSGDSTPSSSTRRHEGQETEAGTAATGRGGSSSGSPANRWIPRGGRRRGSVAT